jgi:hypothetical protein
VSSGREVGLCEVFGGLVESSQPHQGTSQAAGPQVIMVQHGFDMAPDPTFGLCDCSAEDSRNRPPGPHPARPPAWPGRVSGLGLARPGPQCGPG